MERKKTAHRSRLPQRKWGSAPRRMGSRGKPEASQAMEALPATPPTEGNQTSQVARDADVANSGTRLSQVCRRNGGGAQYDWAQYDSCANKKERRSWTAAMPEGSELACWMWNQCEMRSATSVWYREGTRSVSIREYHFARKVCQLPGR
jgi:hypothetical protein